MSLHLICSLSVIGLPPFLFQHGADPKKTIPGSLIAQGLSGLNDANIQIILLLSRIFGKKSHPLSLVADIHYMINTI